jgi:hypothetical protein
MDYYNTVLKFAKKTFSPNHSKKIEVKIASDLLTIRVYKKEGNNINGWFSIIEIKRFYDMCLKDNIINFKFSWEFTSIDLDNYDYIEINFHLK